MFQTLGFLKIVSRTIKAQCFKKKIGIFESFSMESFCIARVIQNGKLRGLYMGPLCKAQNLSKIYFLSRKYKACLFLSILSLLGAGGSTGELAWSLVQQLLVMWAS